MQCRGSLIVFMFRGINKRLPGWIAPLSEKGQWLMRPAKRTISAVRNLTWKELSRGFSIDFWLNLLIFGLIGCLVWGFDNIDGLYGEVAMTLLAAALPLLAFLGARHQEGEERRLHWRYVGFAVFLALTLGLAVSDKFDLEDLGINLVVIMISSPFMFIFGRLVQAKKILAIGMVPAAMALMAYWVAPVLPGDLELRYLLVPLPAVSLVIAPWTALVWILFKGVDRWPDHPTLGPLLESLAMFFLFMPLMILAILVPRTIPGGDDWSVVLATMVGVVFSSVVSEPLRRFLRSYGNLPRSCRCANGNQAEPGRDGGGCGREQGGPSQPT